MMVIPRDLAAHDIHQWLNGGWFADMRDGTPAARKFFSNEEHTIVYSDENGDFERLESRHVRAHWPQCGAINVDRYAVVLTRSSRQQYRRTYNSRVLTIDIPRKWDVMKRLGTEIEQTADDAGIVQAAFQPRYYTYTEALNRLDDGWVTVAMTPYIILAGDTDEQLVYYRGTLHGTIRNGEITPIGEDMRTVSRILKFFEGRVNLCMSENSPRTEATSLRAAANGSASS